MARPRQQRDDLDSPWKEALEQFLPFFLALFFSRIHRSIDWTRGFEFLDKELQKIHRRGRVGRRTVDKLVKVWRKGGRELWVYIHIEIQSQYEKSFARRMYVYHYRLFDRYNQAVVSLAVLADDRPDWRPNQFKYRRWGCALNFRFPTAKLLDYADETALEADPNPFAAVLLAHRKTQATRHDPAERSKWKFRLIQSLYQRHLTAEQARQLLRLIDWFMELPPAEEQALQRELKTIEETQQMSYVTSFERLGREQGVREGVLKNIRSMLKAKFGAAGVRLLSKLRDADDKTLEAFTQAAVTTDSLEDLRRFFT